MSSKLIRLENKGKKTLYPPLPSITVGMGTCGIGSGADKIYEKFTQLQKGKQKEFTLRKVGCFGCCSEEPLVVISQVGKPLVMLHKVEVEECRPILESLLKGKVYNQKAFCKISSWDHHFTSHVYGDAYPEIPEWNKIQFFKSQVKLVMRDCGLIDPTNINEYVAVGGYHSLEKALFYMSKEEVLSQIKDSKLRGRGGAGFPTGLKWELMIKEEAPQKYLICNADEGDPGAYMNRNEMESDPHMIIEGMIIASYVTGATEGIIYVRAEYPLAVERLSKAIEEAYDNNLLGKEILGSSLNFDLQVVEGAGAFVCGEETALIASLEGKAGRPVSKPPFPSQKGYLGYPTTINNLETWSNIPLIIGKGSDWFAKFGNPDNTGTKVFSLVGKVKNTGLVELPLGEKLTTLVYEAGGGSLSKTKWIKAVQSGGPSGGCIPARLFNEKIDYESLAKLGSIMGSGGMVVMDNDNCMVDSARYFVEFTTKESCGNCTPCREGLPQVLSILDRITTGEGKPEDLTLLQELGEHISQTSMCGLGQSAANPVLTTLRYFPEEYESHIHRKICEAGTCEALISELCSNSCPLSMRIPAYIALLKEDRLIEAFTSTLEDNPLPGTIGRICHFHCQMRCRREDIDSPVHQGELHRYLADTLYKMGNERDVYQDMIDRILPSTGKKISIVGAGPAGLSAAFYLSRLGHEVTVYEEKSKAGGVLRSGIPSYRLPREVLDKELELFEMLPIDFVFNTKLGAQIQLSSLKKTSDEVILALGSYNHKNLSLTGSEGGGVVQGTDVLSSISEGKKPRLGKRVVIIGGGNVAIDVARSLWRLKVKVTIAYRRDREDMPANESEIDEAFKEGVNFKFNVSPKRVIRNDKNHLEALEVEKLEKGEYDLSGRRKRTASGDTETLDCDTVIVAIGEQVDTEFLKKENFSVSKWGYLEVEPYHYKTNQEHVWAIGDVINGPSTAAEVMGQAKEVARLIDQHLTGENRFEQLFTPFKYEKNVVATFYEGETIQAEQRPIAFRIGSFEEVNKGYTGRQARMEAERCLRCDVKCEEEELYG